MGYDLCQVQNAELGSVWDGPVWGGIASGALSRHMGTRPSHFPRVEFKAGYNSEYILVMFKVHDRYVRAIRTEPQSDVCLDSCVEFFFTPNARKGQAYFNIEVNCIGTVLFQYHPTGCIEEMIPVKEIGEVDVATSLSGVIDPEITVPTVWTAEFRLPVSILQLYGDVNFPEPGVRWYANFYKCADQTSHPHWLTWSLVEWYRPSFHRPAFFDELRFV